jgi:hypothetical protein
MLLSALLSIDLSARCGTVRCRRFASRSGVVLVLSAESRLTGCVLDEVGVSVAVRSNSTVLPGLHGTL